MHLAATIPSTINRHPGPHLLHGVIRPSRLCVSVVGFGEEVVLRNNVDYPRLQLPPGNLELMQ